MFLKPTDHMLLYNCNTTDPYMSFKWIALHTPDIRRIHEECGVNIALEFVHWHRAEPQRGVYNWETMDMQVNRCLQGGMRVILATPLTVPTFLPDAWYARYHNGTTYQPILSFWCPEAEEYEREFLRQVVARYSGADVTVALHGFLGGESYLWNDAIYYDEWAKRSYKARYGSQAELPASLMATNAAGNRYYLPLAAEVRAWLQDGVVQHLLNQQEILELQHHETWDNAHWMIEQQSENNGNFARAAVFAAYRQRWPDATLWTTQYTYFGQGEEQYASVDALLVNYGAKIIVEAAYCKGLTEGSYKCAIAGGYNQVLPLQWQGQVVSPLHAWTGETELKPWMLDAIKTAVDAWREARDVPQAD